ncbi:MAG: hypothetical protein K6E20_03985 [Acholeplasmatales bacterium]|nr:hypothetical protein [Acholeplasmatales bacterium]
MVEGKFKKSNIYLIIGIVFAVLALAFIVLAIAFGIVIIVAAGIEAAVAGYYITHYFMIKNQYLKIDESGISGKVINYKGQKKLTSLNVKLSFVNRCYVKNGLLILVNQNDQNLEIYNLLNPEEVSLKLSELLANNNQ